MNKPSKSEDGFHFLNRLQTNIIKKKNFELKIQQGLSYINGQKPSSTTDLQLVSFSQATPQPVQQNQKDQDVVCLNSCHELTGQTNWIWKVIANENSSLIFTCGSDKMIYKWTLTSHKYHINNFGIHDGIVYDIILNNSETIVFSASKDTTVKSWSVQDDTMLAKYDFNFEVFKVILHPSETHLIVGGVTGDIQIVNLTNLSRTFLKVHTSVIRDLILTKNGKTLISCSQDKLIKVWDFPTTTLMETGTKHDKEVFSLAISNDERKLYSCGNEPRVLVWELPDLKLIGQFELSSLASCLKLSPSNKTIYIGLQNGQVQVFDALTFVLKVKLNEHSERVTSIFVNENETLVLSSSRDKTVKFWEQHRVRDGLRNFNLNTKRGNLLSLDLSDEAVLIGPVFYKPLNDRPNSYTVTLTDELQNQILQINLKPISFKKKQEVSDFPITVKVQLESVTEFEVPFQHIANDSGLYRDFKYATRFDNCEQQSALSLKKLSVKKQVNSTQIKATIEDFMKPKQNKSSFVLSFDLEKNLAFQIRELLNNYDEDFLDQNEEYKNKIKAIADRVSEIERNSDLFVKLNQDLKSFLETASDSLQQINFILSSALESELLKQNLSDFFFKIKAKNPFLDTSLVKGSLVNGVLNGFGATVQNEGLAVRGQFNNGVLHGQAIQMTPERLLSGSFKEGQLDKKAFCIYEKNGLIRIGDEKGEISKIFLRGITYQAKGISEVYKGPAFLTFPDGTCFTSMIDCLRLVTDVINKHIVFFYGPEKASHFLVYDESSMTLREDGRSLFQINWDKALIVKI